jgi:glycosyltransferase involved in cell wall biosynthesis
MTDRPLISALLPSYNHEAFLEAAVRSALAQTYSPFELIVVDDGSTDGSRAILERFRDDPRVRIVLKENEGISATFNRCAAEAKGDYLAFLGSDDRWRPDHLERAFETLQAKPEADWYYACAELIDAEGQVIESEPSPWGEHHPEGHILMPLMKRGLSFLPFITVVMRADAFRARGPFNAGVVGIQDYDLWLRLAQHHQVAFRDEIAASNGWHGGNVSTPNDQSLARFSIERVAVFRDLVRRLEDDHAHGGELEYARRRLRTYVRRAGNKLLRVGRPLDALPFLKAELTRNPLWFSGYAKLARAVLMTKRGDA